jgi:hypothetical protein
MKRWRQTFMCRIGRHPGVTICNLKVTCVACGKVVEVIDPDDIFARLSGPCDDEYWVTARKMSDAVQADVAARLERKRREWQIAQYGRAD